MKLFAAAITLMVALALTTLTALAGDFAKREIHGFSSDGGLFAFEEYGRQDGSGFVYSNIYVIDTATDQWTAGSPYRVLLEDETKDIWQAREEARIQAGTVMKSFEERGLIAGTNQPSELNDNDDRMVVNPRLVVPPIDDRLEFRIEEYAVQPSELCSPFGETKGFRLLKVGTVDGAATQAVHADNSVPDSRRCPLDYSIADIVTYYPENGTPKFAVLILIESMGFEGPDGRFMAVTGSID